MIETNKAALIKHMNQTVAACVHAEGHRYFDESFFERFVFHDADIRIIDAGQFLDEFNWHVDHCAEMEDDSPLDDILEAEFFAEDKVQEIEEETFEAIDNYGPEDVEIMKLHRSK